MQKIILTLSLLTVTPCFAKSLTAHLINESIHTFHELNKHASDYITWDAPSVINENSSNVFRSNIADKNDRALTIYTFGHNSSDLLLVGQSQLFFTACTNRPDLIETSPQLTYSKDDFQCISTHPTGTIKIINN